ncbi:hypothetical protein SBA2_700004 [Acidobacteriia bacterium SbA2]|nr:hypothetical protein SBA2_700004 [Acidobacteriia bacterium SbA2]
MFKFCPGHENHFPCPYEMTSLTVLVGRALNPTVGKNQHRWKNSLDDDMCRVLEDAAGRLEWTWEVDKKDPKSYPVNTINAFYEIRGWMEDCKRGERPEVEHKGLRLHKSRPPKRFSELVDDSFIKIVYEDQNAGSYSDALRCAASGDRSAGRTFRKILNAVKGAYFIVHYGEHAAPKPRVHFLHRNLLEIADELQLSDLTPEGMAEFLNDLCPCGKNHKPDAIRKLRRRTVHHRPGS